MPNMSPFSSRNARFTGAHGVNESRSSMKGTGCSSSMTMVFSSGAEMPSSEMSAEPSRTAA